MKRNIALFTISILVSLLFAEYVTRIFQPAPYLFHLSINGPHSGYQRSQNPILGYELKPNYRSNNPSLHWGDFPKINSHGQRDIERSYEKTRGVKRIILLGDSVVAGHGIKDLNNTISRQLEKQLQPRSKVEVLNFGVGGYQTLSEAELLKVKGLQCAPDLVILVFENSDFSGENNDFYLNNVPRANNVILKMLISESRLFLIVSVKMNWFGLGNINEGIKNHHRAMENSVEKSIKILKEMSKKNHFDFFVVVWPRFSNVRGHIRGIEDFYPNKEQINHALRIKKILKKYNVDSYQLFHFFMKVYNNKLSVNPTNEFLPSLRDMYTVGDACHPNEYGALIAAKALETILVKRNFV